MAQFARPDNDDSIGAWTDQASGTTNIYTTIDETSASDSDYVRSENNPSTSAYQAGLSAVTDPVSSSGHVLRYRYQKGESGGGSPGTIDVTIDLRQGTTTIASQTHNGISTTVTAGSITLTGGEADSITDYSNLNILITANKSGGARTSWAIITWAEFEVPDAPGSSLNWQVNIGDTWKAVESIQINIGDVWKDVPGEQINIGDVWKTID